MERERWRRIEDLYHAARLLPPDDRARFLAGECRGDESLRSEVESLIAQPDSTWTRPGPDARGMGDILGKRVGHYDVQLLLGAGGMGRVYRARDSRLGRDVALKLLPPEWTGDPDRLARLEREARLLASLNHPNIATIHGIEDGAGIRALVLEFIEGDTLADRIARGPLPLAEALTIARQIGEALDAAHERGIVHRDLKPANIKITPAGLVKVLDFGIATLESGPEGSTPHGSQSPTVTARGTREGVVAGTAAYMSPEQARGLAIDKRTDIWAFGCVLYEMLAGRPAFARQSFADTIKAVLDAEPDWAALPAHAPDAVVDLIHHCVEKDPRERVRDIGDVRRDLSSDRTDTTATSRPRAAMRRSAVAATIVVAAIAAALSTGVVVWFRPRDVAPRVTRLTITPMRGAEFAVGGVDHDLTISPDGTFVVYVGAAGSQLFVRYLDRLEASSLKGLGEPRNPFMSADGRWVGFFSGTATLKKVSIGGGVPIEICLVGDAPRGATWGRDDTVVFATSNTTSGLTRVPSSGGAPVALTTPDQAAGEQDHLWPEFLPDGRSVLFTIVGTSGQTDVAVVDVQTGQRHVVVRGASHARFVHTGHLIYASNGGLRAVGFDLDRLETVGAPVSVLDAIVTTPSGAANFSISDTGTLAYVAGGPQAMLRTLVWRDRLGREVPINAEPRAYVYPRLSPDGTRVALEVRDQENDIWILDVARETLRRLTFGPFVEQFPVWTHDGRRVIYASARGGPRNLFWQAADGSGGVERLSDQAAFHTPAALSPDESQLVTVESASNTGPDIKLMDLAEQRSRVLIGTPFSESNPELSPDGRFFAYQSNESGQPEIYVRRFPNADGQRMISSGGGMRPLWSPTGKEVFYTSGANAVMSVAVDTRTEFTYATPRKVFEGHYYFGAGGVAARTYDVSRDGQRFLMIKPVPEAEESERIIIVQNWLEELKRLVPTR